MSKKKTKTKKRKNKNKSNPKEPKHYSPDLDCKALFKGMESQTVLLLILQMLSLECDPNTEIEFIDTESSSVTGFDDVSYVSSDVIAKLGSKNSDGNDKIIIEFQTYKDPTMGYRLFIYSLNHSKTKEINGELYVEPARCITIYTVLDKPSCGVDVVNVRQYEYEKTGLFEFKEKPTENYFRAEYPFINILALTKEELMELKNTRLDIFIILYLYRYQKDNKLLLNEDVLEYLKTSEEIIKKYEGKDYRTLNQIFMKLKKDIKQILITKKDENSKYEEVLNKMINLKDYPEIIAFNETYDKAKAEGIAEGKAEAEAKFKKTLAEAKAKVKAEASAEAKAKAEAKAEAEIEKLKAELEELRSKIK